MADSYIGNLPVASALTGTEVFPADQGATPTTVAVTANQLKTFIGSGGTPGGSSGQVQFNSAGAFAGIGGSSVSANGVPTFGSVTLTANDPFSITPTFNNSGVVFTAFKVNATDTASAIGTLLIDLQRNSSSKVSADNFGNVIASGSMTAGNGAYMDFSGTIAAKSAGLIGFSGNTSVNNGNHNLDTAFARNAAGVFEVNNGTAGTFRDLKLRGLTFGASFTVGTLPSASTAGDGAWFRVTDLTSPTLGAAPAGSGNVHGTVTSNGTSYTVSQFG